MEIVILLIGLASTAAGIWLIGVIKGQGDRWRADQRADIERLGREANERETKIHAEPAADKRTVLERMRANRDS